MSSTNIFYTSTNLVNFNREPVEIMQLINSSYGTITEVNNLDKTLRYFNNLDSRVLDSSLLTPGLRFSAPGFLVFERPPTKKLVQYIDTNVDSICQSEEEGEDIDPDGYYIPVPWQIYFVTYSVHPLSKYRTTSVKMYFSNTPLNHPDVVLYAPYVHNFFMNGNLCNPMFGYYDEISRYPENLQGVIASAYDWVWNTGFNRDLSECIDQTYAQCRNSSTNSVIKNYKSQVASLNYNSFYYHLSKYEPDEVTQCTWANPSFTPHFHGDKTYFSYLADRYISTHNLTPIYEQHEDDEDEDYEEEDQEYDTDYSSLLRQTPYYNYIFYPHTKIKTYAELIDFFTGDYAKNNHHDFIPVNTSNSFTDTSSLANSIISYFDVSIVSSS